MRKELEKVLEEFNVLNREYELDEYRLIFEEKEIWFIGEFDYEEGSRIAEKMDKVLQKRNKNWYFEADCPGRWVAYLN